MTSISRLIITAIAVLMTITAVHANDDEDHFAATTYGSFIHFTSVPNALFFFEDIEEDDSFEFRKALRNHDIDTVVLASAALKSGPATIQMLLNAGADVMVQDDDGNTPLHYAANFGKDENIQTLLAAGADAKVKDNSGKTPWDYAQDNETLKGTKGYETLGKAQTTQ